MRSLFRFVLIKLHSIVDTWHSVAAKRSVLNIMLVCLVVLKACVPKLCVFYYTVLSLQLVWCVIVTSCECQLDFNKGLMSITCVCVCPSQVRPLNGLLLHDFSQYLIIMWWRHPPNLTASGPRVNISFQKKNPLHCGSVKVISTG